MPEKQMAGSEDVPIHRAGRADGWRLLDIQARKQLGISGEEFVERWNSGAYVNSRERPDVSQVVKLLPLLSG